MHSRLSRKILEIEKYLPRSARNFADNGRAFLPNDNGCTGPWRKDESAGPEQLARCLAEHSARAAFLRRADAA